MKKLLIIILVIITHNGLKAWNGGFCKAYTSETALCFSPADTRYPSGTNISPDAGCPGGQQCVNCDYSVNSTPIGICQNIN